MDAAKRLLISGDLPVTEVCLEVRYFSMGTFSSRFASRIGQPPTEYRRQSRRFFAPPHGWRIYTMPSCFVSFWLGSPQDRKIEEARRIAPSARKASPTWRSS